MWFTQAASNVNQCLYFTTRDMAAIRPMWRAWLSESAWTGLRSFRSNGWTVMTNQLWPCWLFFCLPQKRGKWEILKKRSSKQTINQRYIIRFRFFFPLHLALQIARYLLGSISAALSIPIYVPPEERGRGRRIEGGGGGVVDSFPEQWLIVKPSSLR